MEYSIACNIIAECCNAHGVLKLFARLVFANLIDRIGLRPDVSGLRTNLKAFSAMKSTQSFSAKGIG